MNKICLKEQNTLEWHCLYTAVKCAGAGEVGDGLNGIQRHSRKIDNSVMDIYFLLNFSYEIEFISRRREANTIKVINFLLKLSRSL